MTSLFILMAFSDMLKGREGKREHVITDRRKGVKSKT